MKLLILTLLLSFAFAQGQLLPLNLTSFSRTGSRTRTFRICTAPRVTPLLQCSCLFFSGIPEVFTRRDERLCRRLFGADRLVLLDACKAGRFVGNEKKGGHFLFERLAIQLRRTTEICVFGRGNLEPITPTPRPRSAHILVTSGLARQTCSGGSILLAHGHFCIALTQAAGLSIRRSCRCSGCTGEIDRSCS